MPLGVERILSIVNIVINVPSAVSAVLELITLIALVRARERGSRASQGDASTAVLVTDTEHPSGHPRWYRQDLEKFCNAV